MAVRQRKPDHGKPGRTYAASTSKTPKAQNKGVYVVWILVAFVASFTAPLIWQYYLETRVNAPFPAPQAVEITRNQESELKKLWGSYRSHLYFGMRTRTPESLLFGLLWFAQNPRDGQLHFRYTCEQGDNLAKYGWLHHDGKMFGSQEIVDDDFILTTEFLKRPGGDHGGDWTARVKGRARHGQERYQAVSLLFAVTNEGAGSIETTVQGDTLVEIRGNTPVLGHFKIKFQDPVGKIKLQSFLSSHEDDIYNAKDAVMSRLTYKSKKGDREQLIGLPGSVRDKDGRSANFFVHQVTLELPFEVDVVFESESNEYRENILAGEAFTKEMQARISSFSEAFENRFSLSAKGYSQAQIDLAKAAMSNMIGGIGYFYGNSKIRTRATKEPFDYWRTELYTGVPSRSFFPRGFLWDEGFHQLLVQRWDASITRQVLAHWLDLLNYNGWIPREQILGVEARRKVPDEFVVQHSEYANPPTFFLTIQSLIAHEKAVHHDVTKETVDFLRHVFPRLVVWFRWYNTTQSGKIFGTYRWQGRDEKIDRELNPKTLTSGLDDYPRASHPSDNERHVDLRCWIAFASGVLADIADMIGVSSEKFRETELYLKDNKLLDKLHWSEELKMYADFGNHTKFMKLEWVPVRKEPNAPKKLIRVVRSKHGPSLKFVNEFGYISLFPFLLKILNPSSPKLAIILQDIRDPEKLWTNFGLRSLSKAAPMYNKHNTEHDKPYWRGPIWININFLAVKALHHYGGVEGPNKLLAYTIYRELRTNIADNIYRQYERTGYIWEQYDDATGKGQGCYPFTGWSGLVTLIMAEDF